MGWGICHLRVISCSDTVSVPRHRNALEDWALEIRIPLLWTIFIKKLLQHLLNCIIPTADIYGPKNLQMVLEWSPEELISVGLWWSCRVGRARSRWAEDGLNLSPKSKLHLFWSNQNTFFVIQPKCLFGWVITKTQAYNDTLIETHESCVVRRTGGGGG